MNKNNIESKQVIIIGAGISGLTAGIYARRAGFNVTILESHNIPGGLSTSWSRKSYLFEGGMHWLTGSSERMPLNRIWKEIGALKENNPVFYKDPFYTFVGNGKTVNLYRDVKKLEQEFLSFAPEDSSAIKMLCKDIRLFKSIHMVITDIPGLKTANPAHPKLSEFIAMLPAMLRYPALKNQSYTDYVARFKNKDLRALLMSIIGERYNAAAFVYTLASFASGDCGYPEGGSLQMARNMADTFEGLGGKIQYQTKVEKVVIESGKVKGVKAGDNFIPADSVIVTQDLRSAVDKLFNPPLKESWINKMKKEVITEQNMFICLGLKADLKNLPRAFVFPLKEPFEAGGLKVNELRINNYALYQNYAPEGCTALTCLLLGNSYEYWKNAKKDGSYKQKKQDLLERFISALSEFLPDVKSKIEVTDVATPVTYERYCHSHEGSWMSVWKAGGAMFVYPAKSKSVNGLYFAGQRMMMPGGLPIAAATGRIAVQYLCRDNGVIFV
ncbi:MAG: phytoene desaturase family protein [Treponema sp.]